MAYKLELLVVNTWSAQGPAAAVAVLPAGVCACIDDGAAYGPFKVTRCPCKLEPSHVALRPCACAVLMHARPVLRDDKLSTAQKHHAQQQGDTA